jgi:transitional endoplasmic reticulum ATPase
MPLSEACAAELPRIADVTHGFVGADIMELCRESGLNALRRSTAALVNHLDAFNLQSESITIEPQDFRRALETIRPSAIRESFIAVPDVSWTDIGGLEDIKRELRQSVLRFLKQPEALEAAGVTAPRGILLHGPSGTGKTMIAKAIASEAAVNFIAVDGPEIFGKWLGESEAAIRHVFRVARQLSPCIVFFDQLDALVPNRGTDSGSRTTERVVSQILSELDGIRSLSNILVIGATNRIDLVDPSVLRPGRLGQRFFIPLPDETGREAILRLHLANARLAKGEALDDVLAQLVLSSGGLSGAELGALCDKAKLRAFSEDRPVSRDDLTHALVSLRDAQPG